MYTERATSFLTEAEIYPLYRRLKARAGIVPGKKATKSWGAGWSEQCWYFYWQFWANIAQGRGWHRFSPRKKAAARSFARAVVAARQNRVNRAKKEA